MIHRRARGGRLKFASRSHAFAALRIHADSRKKKRITAVKIRSFTMALRLERDHDAGQQERLSFGEHRLAACVEVAGAEDLRVRVVVATLDPQGEARDGTYSR